MHVKLKGVWKNCYLLSISAVIQHHIQTGDQILFDSATFATKTSLNTLPANLARQLKLLNINREACKPHSINLKYLTGSPFLLWFIDRSISFHTLALPSKKNLSNCCVRPFLACFTSRFSDSWNFLSILFFNLYLSCSISITSWRNSTQLRASANLNIFELYVLTCCILG